MLLSAVLRCHYYAALSTLLLTRPKWLQLNARCCSHVTAESCPAGANRMSLMLSAAIHRLRAELLASRTLAAVAAK